MLGFNFKAVAAPDRREAAREEVFHRARGLAADGSPIVLEVVNISASGFMARTEAGIAEGDIVTVSLPVVGELRAAVRWSLGGRAGCEFARRIDLAAYLELLGRLMKG